MKPKTHGDAYVQTCFYDINGSRPNGGGKIAINDFLFSIIDEQRDRKAVQMRFVGATDNEDLRGRETEPATAEDLTVKDKTTRGSIIVMVGIVVVLFFFLFFKLTRDICFDTGLITIIIIFATR